MSVESSPSRRGFFGWVAAAVAAVPVVGGLFVLGRSVATPAVARRPARLRLCDLSDVPETGVLARPISYEMRRGARVENVAQMVFVTREPGSGEIVALSSRCTHLGCQVVARGEDAESPLYCPCHDATFAATGEVLSGPPRRGLDRLPIEVGDDGSVEMVLR